MSSDLTRTPEDPERGRRRRAKWKQPPTSGLLLGRRCVLLVPTLFGDDP